MPSNTCIPHYKPGHDITCSVAAAVTGSRFVAISATAKDRLPLISPAAAKARAFGVAAYDAAVGAVVPVVRGSGTVLDVTAAGVIAAGTDVAVGTDGNAAAASTGDVVVAVAVSAGTANNPVTIALL